VRWRLGLRSCGVGGWAGVGSTGREGRIGNAREVLYQSFDEMAVGMPLAMLWR
jgi:hypothetical protein